MVSNKVNIRSENNFILFNVTFLFVFQAASLKHEVGGVLGEVRRKLQDCRKLQELMKSLVKLRELRKSEGEKKGPFFDIYITGTNLEVAAGSL